MHPGVWIGDNFENAERRVLILGESHYDTSKDKNNVGKVTFTTRGVIETYLREKTYPFFTKIANTFGYESDEEIHKFYNLICFGNYVNVVVDKDGEKNGSYFIEKFRQEYNKELIQFCNEQFIDIIACFSIKTYDYLPSGGQKEEEYVITRKKGNPIKTRKWSYKKGTVVSDSMALDKDLLVYGIWHPSTSGGYDTKLEYEEYIKDQQELKWLCNKSTI